MRYKISNENFVSFRNLIARLRYIVANFEIINKVFSSKNKNIKIKNDQKEFVDQFTQRNNNNFFNNRKKIDNRLENPKQNSLYQNFEYKYSRFLIDRIVKKNRY